MVMETGQTLDAVWMYRVSGGRSSGCDDVFVVD